MAIGIDVTVSTHKSGVTGSGITSPTFSTSEDNELLLAFIETDGGSSGNYIVGGVTGAVLTWTKVVSQGAHGYGGAEIWRAFAPTTVSNASVTVTPSPTSGCTMTITIMSFTGVDATSTDGSSAIGSTSSATGTTGKPSTSLTTTRDGSWVLANGNDWSGSTARTLGSGQTLVYEWRDTADGNDFWVQRQTSATVTSGTIVTMNDTAPSGDKWNLAAVEVLPAVSGGGTSTPVQYLGLLGVGSF